jgi:hypothetical protein
MDVPGCKRQLISAEDHLRPARSRRPRREAEEEDLVMVEKSDLIEETCPTCKGLGVLLPKPGDKPDINAHTCPECHGTKRVTKPRPQ